jgi:hypothetical protein
MTIKIIIKYDDYYSEDVEIEQVKKRVEVATDFKYEVITGDR